MIDCGRNPISGRTLSEEIEIARAIGGRLPYCAYISLLRRGIIKPPEVKPRIRPRNWRGRPKCDSGILSKPKTGAN